MAQGSAWLRRLKAFAMAGGKGRSGPLPHTSEQLSVYVSGTVVALAHGNFAGDAKIALRADPLEQLTELQGRLEAQLESLRLSRSAVAGGCNLVLAPEMYNLSLVDRPDVADEELTEAVRWLIQDQVDYPMEDAALDVFELPRSASRERPMVFAVSLQSEFLSTLVREVNAAGVSVANVDVSELAIRNLIWRQFPQPDQSIAALRLTANSGLISISRGDELYLARRLSGVPEQFAESAWESFRERLLLQVQRSIDYYESAMNQPHCNMLVVACTGGWSGRVTEYLAEMLPIPIRTINEMLADEFALTLYNPEPRLVDWSTPADDQVNAIAAGMPALGGVLRGEIEQALAEVA